MHLESVPLEREIPDNGTGGVTRQKQVEKFFPVPVTVNSGDWVVVISAERGTERLITKRRFTR